MVDLDAIKARLAAATPGKWVYYASGHMKTAACVVTDDDDKKIIVADDMEDNDALFLADAPRDIDALVAEVERMREYMESIRDSGRQKGLGFCVAVAGLALQTVVEASRGSDF